MCFCLKKSPADFADEDAEKYADLFRFNFRHIRIISFVRSYYQLPANTTFSNEICVFICGNLRELKQKKATNFR